MSFTALQRALVTLCVCVKILSYKKICDPLKGQIAFATCTNLHRQPVMKGYQRAYAAAGNWDSHNTVAGLQGIDNVAVDSGPRRLWEGTAIQTIFEDKLI